MAKTDWRTGKRTNAGRNGKAENNGAQTDSDAGQRIIRLVTATEIVSDKPVWAMEYDSMGCIQLGTMSLVAG